MKRDFHKRIGAVLLSALVCVALTPGAAWAAEQQNAKPEPASEKVETVRVTANAAGNPERVEVDTTLRNAQGAIRIVDASTLTGIVPKEDGGDFTEEEGSLIWQADGADISYTGESNENVPVKVHVTYKLDGKTIAPEKLAGASGHVAIRYDYENTAVIDGTAMPFTMISAILLDDARFSNIEVTNGKLIADEGRTIVVGYALPGMQASLELDTDDAELPAYFEFEADVVDFELNPSLTIASTDLFNDFNREDIDISELSDSAGELSSALADIIAGVKEFRDGIDELNDGAKTLADALSALRDGIPELASGVSQLETGSQDLKDGLDAAAEGLSDLDTGASGVSNGINAILYGDGKNLGLSDLSAMMPQMVDGAQGVVDGLKTLTTEGLPALKTAVDGISASLSSDQVQQLAQLVQAAQMEISGYNAAVDQLKRGADDASAVADELIATLGSIDTEGMTAEQKAAIATSQAQAEGLKQAISGISAGAAQMSTEYSAQAAEALGAFAGSIEELKNGLASISESIDGIIANIDEGAIAGAEQLHAAASNVSYGINMVVTGLQQLYDAASQVAGGVSQLGSQDDGIPAAAAGAGELASGLAELDENVGTLEGGVGQAADGASALHEGTEAASEGTVELLDGLQRYNDEGISELVERIDVELQGYIDRLFASADLGRAYDNFAGKAEGTPSSVKFIFEIAGIAAGE